MKYFFVNNVPCASTAQVKGGVEITADDYNMLLQSIKTFDGIAPEGYYYQLQIDGSWALRDLPPAPPYVEDPDEIMRRKAEAYDILMGGEA